jgi:hypothetical protein
MAGFVRQPPITLSTLNVLNIFIFLLLSICYQTLLGLIIFHQCCIQTTLRRDAQIIFHRQ